MSAQQTSILFLGNSYTGANNLPGTLYNLALAGGDTVYQESNTPGGYTLEEHSTNVTSLSKIASRNWDFVVLQEQSQKPAFPPGQVEAQTYPFAADLVDSIKSNYECTEPVFYMTWGRKNGDQQNCQNYTPLCTFEGMNGRLRESYLEMGIDNNATVAPCGAAWYHMKLINSTFWDGLYSGDGSHPSAWGTYLNACVFYATIFRQSPVGIPYYSSIGQQDAETLQQLAEDIVIDSTSTWFIGHQDVEAAAEYMNNGDLSVDFSGNSSNANEHSWDFGDGSDSNSEDPTYTYSDYGTYTVTYTASSNCGSDVIQFDVSVIPSGIDDNNPLRDMLVLLRDEQLLVKNSLLQPIQLMLTDINGRQLNAMSVGGGQQASVICSVSSGVYVIKLTDGERESARKIVIH